MVHVGISAHFGAFDSLFDSDEDYHFTSDS